MRGLKRAAAAIAWVGLFVVLTVVLQGCACPSKPSYTLDDNAFLVPARDA